MTSPSSGLSASAGTRRLSATEDRLTVRDLLVSDDLGGGSIGVYFLQPKNRFDIHFQTFSRPVATGPCRFEHLSTWQKWIKNDPYYKDTNGENKNTFVCNLPRIAGMRQIASLCYHRYIAQSTGIYKCPYQELARKVEVEGNIFSRSLLLYVSTFKPPNCKISISEILVRHIQEKT
jgi:hypothetical protein